MPSFAYEDLRPVVHPTAFVHPTAVLIGDVVIGPGCLIGPGAALRGDIGRLEVQAGSNVQDNCILHCFPGKGVLIEPNGHVGHGSILHGCTVRRNALIGMNAVVMDDAVIGANAFVAAMTFVPAGMEVPDGTLVAGIPAKVKRHLEPREIDWKTRGTEVYQELARRSLATMREVEPLTEIEDDRPTLPDVAYRAKHED